MSEDLELNMRFLDISHVDLKLNKNVKYNFFDFPALKSEIIKENDKVNKHLFDNLLQKLSFYYRFPKDKK